MTFAVFPEFLLGDCDIFTLLALEGFDLALRVDPWYPDSLFIFQVFWCQAVFIFQVSSIVILYLGHVVTFLGSKMENF